MVAKVRISVNCLWLIFFSLCLVDWPMSLACREHQILLVLLPCCSEARTMTRNQASVREKENQSRGIRRQKTQAANQNGP